MTTIRYSEVWDHLRTRLFTARMQRVLGPGRIYLNNEDYSQPEGDESKPWARLVLVPSQNLWLDQTGVGPTRAVAFLTRAEVNAFKDPGFNAQKVLDAIQDECEVQLRGYTIPVDAMAYAVSAFPIWLARGSQPLPLWDDTRGLSFTSAEWRVELAPK